MNKDYQVKGPSLGSLNQSQCIPDRQPLIADALDKLDSDITRLSNNTEKLLNRLVPILRQEPCEPCAKAGVPSAPSSVALVERLEQFQRTIQHINDSILSTTDKLEL